MPDEKDGWELSVSRQIAAPPELVWRIMTERKDAWFCPQPWRFEVISSNACPGGHEISVMHGPDGERIESEGIYLAWEPGRRFVVTDAVAGDFTPRPAFMIGFFEIMPDGDGTRYSARARHWSEEAMQQHKAMGFDEGWGAAADQLKALCEAEWQRETTTGAP